MVKANFIAKAKANFPLFAPVFVTIEGFADRQASVIFNPVD